MGNKKNTDDDDVLQVTGLDKDEDKDEWLPFFNSEGHPNPKIQQLVSRLFE